MKTYLGVNSKTNECCIIYTDGITSKMESTNWNGRDSIQRTCKIKNFVLTGEKQKYNGIHCGVDYDMGHEYPYNFHFDELWSVK